jgi:hypothetical protein
MNWLVNALDLKGNDDAPAFSKIGWWAVFIASLATGHFGIGFGMLLGAWAFGRSTMMTFLSRDHALPRQGE